MKLEKYILNIAKNINNKIKNFKKNLEDESKEEVNYEIEEEKFDSIEQFQRSCVHEAGHYVCAKLLGIGIEEVVISVTSSFVALETEGKDSEEDLRKTVNILYGGILAERIVFHSASNGFLGCEDADMESANELLRDLVIIADNELSLTGLEEDIIKEKMIILSKEIEKETKQLLLNNVTMLEETANKFINENKHLLK